MPDFKNRRLISGDRVICQCSLDLPKVDPFNNFKIRRSGYMVFNTRGGSLYLSQQFTDNTVTKLFNPGEPSLIKNLAFQPVGAEQITMGNIKARFLKFTDGQVHSGMILRFVNLEETQLDLLNLLSDKLPKVGNAEDELIRQVMG